MISKPTDKEIEAVRRAVEWERTPPVAPEGVDVSELAENLGVGDDLPDADADPNVAAGDGAKEDVEEKVEEPQDGNSANERPSD